MFYFFNHCLLVLTFNIEPLMAKTSLDSSQTPLLLILLIHKQRRIKKTHPVKECVFCMFFLPEIPTVGKMFLF